MATDCNRFMINFCNFTSSIPLRFPLPAVLVIDKYLVLLVWQIIAVDLCFPALKNSSACLLLSFDFLKSTPKSRHHRSSYILCGFSAGFSFQCRAGKMVRCQIWCVSKLILHRLTLCWLHPNSMKIIKSTRSYIYQLYSTCPLVQQLCLQHILTTLAQMLGQLGQREMTLHLLSNLLDLPYCAVDELENSQKTNAF